MKEAENQRLSVIKDYLRRRGVEPDFAPVFLDELKRGRVKPWPRLVEIILAAIGVYCVCRHVVRFFLGW